MKTLFHRFYLALSKARPAHRAATREQKLLTCFAIATAAAIALTVAVGPWKTLGVIIALVALGVTFLRPDITIFFLAVYTPLEPFILKFVPDDLYVVARYFPEALIYLLVATVIFRLLTRRSRPTATPIDLPFVFFLLVALTSLVINFVAPVYGLLGLRQIIRFILIFFVVAHLAPERQYIRRLTYTMFGVMVFESLLGLVQAIIGAPLDEFLIPSERRFFESIQLTTGTTQSWSPGTRIFATMGRYDQLGTFLSFFLLIISGLWYQSKDKLRRQRLMIMAVVALPALVLTMSRASWFGFALGLFLIGAILMKDNRVRLAYLAVVIAAVGYLTYSGLAVRYITDYPEQTLAERFFETFSYERWRGEYYGYGRLYWIVQTVTAVVPSAPIFGVGPGQYGGGAAAALSNYTVYQKLNLPFGVYGSEGYIDNNWFSLWGETGTLGLAFYIWMFVALGLMSWQVFIKAQDKLARGLALGFLGCLTAVTLQAFLATFLEVRTLALYLWLYAAFVFVLGQREGVFRR